MRNRYIFVLLVALLTSVGILADRQTDDMLSKLDESLAQRDRFEQQKLDRIKHLKEMMGQAKAQGRQFEQTYALYNEYKSYCYDSARNYAYECLAISQRENNAQRIVKSKNAIAFSLISAGILSEAHEVMMSINSRQLKDSLLSEYYDNYSRLWRSMADWAK